MRNRLNSKNPFANDWLTNGNKGAGSASSQAAAEAKRQLVATQAETSRQLIELWRGKTAPVLPDDKKAL